MPILNFAKAYATHRAHFIADKTISDINKKYVLQFIDALIAKGFSYSRLSIYLRQLPYILRHTKDIKADMHNQEKINRIFAQVRTQNSNKDKQLAAATYQIIVSTSLVFVRWLNNKKGEDGQLLKPSGFIDIKNAGKKDKAMRNLRPEDMLNWDDCEKMLSFTADTQLRAQIACLLEGGFRPSEFIDLKKSNVHQNGKYALVRVEAGKTGARDVVLCDAVPYLLKWLSAHPLEDANAPLWVTMREGKFTPYTYANLKKRIKDVAARAKINKPVFIYNFRHSACLNAKKLGIQDSMASRNFGHSVETFSRVYGRLTSEDIMQAFGKAKGDKDMVVEARRPMPQTCQRCGEINTPKANFCNRCASPLNVAAALDVEDENQRRIEDSVRTILAKDLRVNERIKSVKMITKKR